MIKEKEAENMKLMTELQSNFCVHDCKDEDDGSFKRARNLSSGIVLIRNSYFSGSLFSNITILFLRSIAVTFVFVCIEFLMC